MEYRRYILTGYFDNYEYHEYCQVIAHSDNFEVCHVLLENLLSWDITMDIVDSWKNEVIMKSSDYDPPKEYR